MNYRYITIPQDIELATDDGKPARTVSFWELLRTRIRDQAHFGKSLDALLSAVAIESEFRGKQPGEVGKLAEPEWLMLVESVKAPSEPYIVGVAAQVVPFLLAITRAPDVDPEA